MIELRRAPASTALRSVVRGYQQRTGNFVGNGVVVPVTARPNSFIEVYFCDTYQVRIASEPFAMAPGLVMVGPDTHRRIDLLMRGTVGAFNIQFQASALNRLFGISMTALSDAAAPAVDVGGPALARLHDVLNRAVTFEARVEAAETWLLARVADARPTDAVDHAATMLRRASGRLRIQCLAAYVDLSPRQFQRRFIEQVGMPPKLYARLCRFDALLADRSIRPHETWTTLAQSHGYFDQSHLLRDFHAFAACTPGDIVSGFQFHGR